MNIQSYRPDTAIDRAHEVDRPRPLTRQQHSYQRRKAESFADPSSERGAMDIAEKIHSYWLERGHDVAVSVRPLPGSAGYLKTGYGGAIWIVRSTLINGLPRGGRADGIV